MAITNSVQSISVSKQTRKQTYASKLIANMPKDTLTISAQALSLASQVNSVSKTTNHPDKLTGTQQNLQHNDQKLKTTMVEAKTGPVTVPINERVNKDTGAYSYKSILNKKQHTDKK